MFSQKILICLGLLVTGCNTPEYPVHSPKNQVRHYQERHVLTYSNASENLSKEELSRLDSKLISSGLHKTSIHVSLPAFINNALYEKRLTALRKIFSQKGIKSSQIHMDKAIPLPSSKEIVIEIDHYQVVPPNCSRSANNVSEWQGCTLENNMAAMISDPKTLIEGQKLEGTDAVLSSKAIRAYKGEGAKGTQKQENSSNDNPIKNDTGNDDPSPNANGFDLGALLKGKL